MKIQKSRKKIKVSSKEIRKIDPLLIQPRKYNVDTKRSKVLIDFPDGNKGIIQIVTMTLTIELTCLNGTKESVTFTKNNRSEFYHDSRDPRKSLTRNEVVKEVTRLLINESTAKMAMFEMDLH